MSYQDGRRVEALEAAVKELRERCEKLEHEVRALTHTVGAVNAKLIERPALARRRA